MFTALIEPFQFSLCGRQLGSQRSGSAGLSRPRCEKDIPKIKESTLQSVFWHNYTREKQETQIDHGQKHSTTAEMISSNQSSLREFNFKPFPSDVLELFQGSGSEPSSKRISRNDLRPMVSKWWVSNWPLPCLKGGKPWWQRFDTDPGVSRLRLGSLLLCTVRFMSSLWF